MNWYYEKAGQRMGPVPEGELDRLITTGEVMAATLVWSEGMANWTPLGQARPSSAVAATGLEGEPPAGFIRCTATGKYFPPSEIVSIDGKPYSAAAKPAVLQGVMQSGVVPAGFDTSRDGPAWERREQLGMVKAGWETIKAVMLQPSEAFATMKREGGVGAPLLFVVIVGTISGIVGLLYEYLFNLGLASLIPAMAGPNAAAATKMSTGYFLGMAIFMPVLIAIVMFMGAGFQHLALMICGGAKQPYETTFRTYCYSSGSVYILQLVPVFGAIVGGIWGLVCTCIGLSKTHEISIGRAVLAVFLPMLVCGCLAGLVFVAIFGAAAAAQGSH